MPEDVQTVIEKELAQKAVEVRRTAQRHQQYPRQVLHVRPVGAAILGSSFLTEHFVGLRPLQKYFPLNLYCYNNAQEFVPDRTDSATSLGMENFCERSLLR